MYMLNAFSLLRVRGKEKISKFENLKIEAKGLSGAPLPVFSCEQPLCYQAPHAEGVSESRRERERKKERDLKD
jgi:hypothetical protein